MLRATLSAVFLLWAVLCVPVAFGQTTVPPDVSAEQAREVLDTLQDAERRDEVVRVLEVIASEAPAEHEMPAVEESPLAAMVPLEEGGLVARTLDLVQAWAAGLRVQLLRISEAVGALPDWFESVFLTAEGRALLGQAALDLAIVFGAGLCLEWLLRRVLRRSVRSLMSSAHQADARPTPIAPVVPVEAPPSAVEVLAARRGGVCRDGEGGAA